MTRSLLLTSPTLANAARRSLFAMALSVAALGHVWAQSAVPWQVDTYYAAGTVVSHEGRLYRALVNQVNWAATGWNPNTTALWTPVSGSATASSSTPTVSTVTSTTSTSTATSPTPSTPSNTGSAASGASGACATPWSSTSIYTGGNLVSIAAINYRANWWTAGDNPSSRSGPAGSGQPWTALGACSAAAASTPASTGTTPTTGNSTSASTTPSSPPNTVAGNAATATPTNPPVTASPTASLSDPSARSASQSSRAYTVYYPSWSDNWFDASGKSLDEVFRASTLARIPSTYTHVVVAFARPNFSWAGLQANTWAGTGIDFNSRPSDIKAAVDVLRARNIKVLLAVGGATYNDWAGLAAEGHAGRGPTIDALARIMTDLGFDGLDVDFEIEGVQAYAGAVKAMRRAVDQAGGGRLLAVAAWSTGADCTAATALDPQCAGKGTTYWGGKAGLERQLVRTYPELASAFDIVNIMSYDARFEHYDGVTAWRQYRELFPSGTIVSIGFQTAPEGWAGGQLVVNNADAQCTGSVILQDSYGFNVNQPYSVERYLQAVTSSSSGNRNRRDGAMLWHAMKSATGTCGSAPLAAPGTISQKAASMLALPFDPALQASPWR